MAGDRDERLIEKLIKALEASMIALDLDEDFFGDDSEARENQEIDAWHLGHQVLLRASRSGFDVSDTFSGE